MSIQAKAGGEYGANGEWYKGGAFINTVAKNPKGVAKKTKPSRVKMVLIEPGVRVEEKEGCVAIFQIVNALTIDGPNETLKIRDFNRERFGEQYCETVEQLIKDYNKGERWINYCPI